MAKTHVLMIFPEVPAAVGSGGQVRSWHFLKGVAQVARVTACVLADESKGIPDCGQLPQVRVIQPRAGFGNIARANPREFSNLVRSFRVLLAPWRNAGRELILAGQSAHARLGAQQVSMLRRFHAALLRGIASWGRHLFRIDPVGSLLRRDAWENLLPDVIAVCQQAPPELLWCEHSYFFPLAADLWRKFPRARFICNAHNVEFALHAGIARGTAAPLLRRWLELETGIVRSCERRMLEHADCIACCSEADAARLRTLTDSARAKIQAFPNGVDTDYFQAAPPSGGPPCLLFAGTAGYPPNDDAVAWLVGEIFPLIRAAVPECRLLLVGRHAAVHWSRWLEQEPAIELASDVPDMRPWLRRATVCVVPLRSGSGTRLKILEAMSSGRAVVSTTIGAEGIEGSNGTHWLLADEPAHFAAAVLRLLGDVHERRTMELDCRQHVTGHYGWECLTDGIAELIAK